MLPSVCADEAEEAPTLGVTTNGASLLRQTSVCEVSEVSEAKVYLQSGVPRSRPVREDARGWSRPSINNPLLIRARGSARYQPAIHNPLSNIERGAPACCSRATLAVVAADAVWSIGFRCSIPPAGPGIPLSQPFSRPVYTLARLPALHHILRG